jgi:hypothetical protein
VQPKSLSPLVESYGFWDVVTLWARERLEHEDIVARALARAVICDGLRIQSVESRWIRGDDHSIEFKGLPYVGYCAKPGSPVCVLRTEVLEHLLAIVHRAELPLRDKLTEAFILRQDFRMWAIAIEPHLPNFWFGVVMSRSH